MSLRKVITAVLLTVAMCGVCVGQHRDPLTQTEAQQLRAASQAPERRVRLLLSFAADRLLAAERNGLHSSREKDLQTAARDLQDFTVLMDRLDAELAGSNAQGDTLQSALSTVLEGESGFARRLDEFQRLGTAQQRILGTPVQHAMAAVENSRNAVRLMLSREQQRNANPPIH